METTELVDSLVSLRNSVATIDVNKNPVIHIRRRIADSFHALGISYRTGLEVASRVSVAVHPDLCDPEFYELPEMNQLIDIMVEKYIRGCEAMLDRHKLTSEGIPIAAQLDRVLINMTTSFEVNLSL